MISLEQLTKTLANCKDIPINLAKINNSSDIKQGDSIVSFMQKDAVEMRIDELEKIYANKELLAMTTDYTMNKVLDDNITNNNLNCVNSINLMSQEYDINIPTNALLTYVENGIVEFPEVLLNLFKKPSINLVLDNWYLFGFKNPESFCKSILMLLKAEFVIKGKSERLAWIYTFKKEMGLQLDYLFRKCDYKSLKFKRNDMFTHLLNKVSYNSYDFIVLCVDFCHINLFIIDIIKNTYIDINYNELPSTFKNDYNHINDISDINDKYLILIKYVNHTYLPLMSNKENNYINKNIINEMKKYLEEDKEFIIPFINRNYHNPKNNTTNIINTNTNDNINNSTNIINSTKIEQIKNNQNNIKDIKDISEIEIINNDNMNEIYEEIPLDIIDDKKVNLVNKIETKLKIQFSSKMSLTELQNIANINKINIKKLGKTGKEINKTKQELIDEFTLSNNND